MILVDTSVLIDFLAGTSGSHVAKLEYILKAGIDFGINNYIYQELLQGTKTQKEFNTLKEYLSTQTFYQLSNERKSFESAAMAYFKCRKNGITVRSTIDLLIAQTAVENKLLLLHNDRDFDNIAKVIKELKFY